MPSLLLPLLLPEFHDAASARNALPALNSARAALAAAQAALRDEAILMATVEIAEILREHPAIGEFGVATLAGFANGNKRPRFRLHVAKGGLPRVAGSYDGAFANCHESARPHYFNPAEIEQMSRVDQAFSAWSCDERFAEFAAQCALRLETKDRDRMPIDHAESMERQLLEWLGRPDLWATLESRILGAQAREGSAAPRALRV